MVKDEDFLDSRPLAEAAIAILRGPQVTLTIDGVDFELSGRSTEPLIVLDGHFVLTLELSLSLKHLNFPCEGWISNFQ